MSDEFPREIRFTDWSVFVVDIPITPLTDFETALQALAEFFGRGGTVSKRKYAVAPNDMDGLDLPASGRTLGHSSGQTFSSETAGGVEAYRRPSITPRITDRPKFPVGDALRDSWEPNRSVKKQS